MFPSELPPLFVYVAAFLFGSTWGSFFNVAIYRWPREMSVVRPASHCPACGKPVPAYRNVPIFGWLFLRGKAACCGAKLSPRYVAVEALAGAVAVALAHRFVVNAAEGRTLIGAIAECAVYFAFVGGLIVATFVDLEFMEIPDEVSLPGAALGLATAGLRGLPGAEAAALGAGGGFLICQLLFVWTYEHLTGRRGMGEGDSKLLMMIGAFVGWRGVLFALLGGAVQGVLAALLLYAIGKPLAPTPPPREGDDDNEDEREEDDSPALRMPFGPFLALGAIEFLFFGDRLIDAYFAWMGA
jgi:leader peptidase (prepilin peptidase)/N-methyltransferase